MAYNSNNIRHKNSEILAILDEAKDASKLGENERVFSLLAIVSSYRKDLDVDRDGFVIQREYKEINRENQVDKEEQA